MIKKFYPGDIIEFCGDQFLVLANYGNSGKVQEWPSKIVTIDNFKWSFQDSSSKLIGTEEEILRKEQIKDLIRRIST